MQSESLHFGRKGEDDRLAAFKSSRLSSQRELKAVSSTVSKDCTDERQLHTERLLALDSDHRGWHGSKKRQLGDEDGDENADVGEEEIDTVADPKDRSTEPEFPVITDDDYSYITTADLIASDANERVTFLSQLHAIQVTANAQDRLGPKRRRLKSSEHNEHSPPPGTELSANNDAMDLDIDSQTDSTDLANEAHPAPPSSLVQPDSARFRDYLNRRGVPMFRAANVSFDGMRHHASPSKLRPFPALHSSSHLSRGRASS